MSTKSLLHKEESDELARLLAKARLKAAGVTAHERPEASDPEDPDFRALLKRARSIVEPSSGKGRALRLRPDVVKKLAGV